MSSYELSDDFANVTCVHIHTQEREIRFNSETHLHNFVRELLN